MSPSSQPAAVKKNRYQSSSPETKGERRAKTPTTDRHALHDFSDFETWVFFDWFVGGGGRCCPRAVFLLLPDNRIRKVRCSRTWPSCARCTEKRIDCHYGNLIPSAYDPLHQYTLGLGLCVLSSMADVVSGNRVSLS
jgi:hypothetical protein